MTATFVDPRTEPDPRAPRPPARFAAEAAELEELHRSCREGRLYDVERWIRDGRPLQLRAGFRIDGRRNSATSCSCPTASPFGCTFVRTFSTATAPL